MPGPRRQHAVASKQVVSWIIGVVGVTIVVTVAVWLVWKMPGMLAGPVPPEPDLGARDAEITAAATRYAAYRADVTSSRTGLIAGLAGLAAVGSLMVTARTYRLSLHGQIADRYTKAVAQLGDDKLAVRLGGVYALERLALDSGRDHPTVIEVLGAYVRDGSRMRKTPPDPNPTGEIEALTRDVQAALSVLGRLPNHRYTSRGVDLSGVDLRSAALYDANLANAELTGTKLARARLFNANLTQANLYAADATEARFVGADLTKARLHHAKLIGADLIEADLTEANLTGADLTGARLLGATLHRANLANAVLNDVDLDSVNLSGCLGLEAVQLESARGTSRTRLPTGVNQPASWDSRPNLS